MSQYGEPVYPIEPPPPWLQAPRDGGMPRHVRPGLRLRVSASIAQSLLLIVLVADVVLSKAIWDRYQLVKRALANPGTVSDSDLRSADDYVHTTAIIYLVAHVLAIIGFIVWFYRAYRSAAEHNDLMTRYGSGWAIGVWFVPVLSAWRPYKMTNDIRCASELPPTATDSDRRGHPIIRVWWWLWIASAVSVRFYNGSESSVDAFYSTARWELVSGGLTLLAGVCAIAVVEKLTSSNDRRRLELLGARPDGGEPTLGHYAPGRAH